MTAPWPENFTFGVATAGFQIEGGYNGVDEPRNNWADWEDSGRIARAGRANNFWHDYEHQLDLAAAMGLQSFRLSIEWTRVEPRDGEIDETAVAHYRAILAAIHDRGMKPLVTLHHFTNPAWLGQDPWTSADAWRRLAGWYDTAVARFGDLCSWWITSNEINIYAINCYFHGIFPPGRKGDLSATLSAIDHLLAAHIVGYQAMKRRQPDALIATNNYSFSIYELDRFLLDTLYVHQLGIAPNDQQEWLQERRRAHYQLVPGGRGIYAPLEAAARRYVARQLPLTTGFPTAVQAMREAQTPQLQDVAQLDYYAPTVAEHVTLPGKKTAGGRWHRAGRPLWDDRPDPTMFLAYVTEAGQDGLPVWVVENGMCVRRTSPSAVHPRLDGWTRTRYLQENIGALVKARQQGVDVQGYWHWTLVDNFEWGSYEPRFGLYGLNADHTIAPTDTSGDDVAAAYRRIIEGLARNDFSVVQLP
jgi:beta-glucosidase/6-phospho-beta-glucosidase/beta-galactosidase